MRNRASRRRATLAAAALLAAGPACAQESAFDEFSAPAPGAVPIVTPTYLRQPVRDIPATVTVIDAETIATFGYLTIPNVLRMIEGTPPQRLSWVNYDLKSGKRTSFGPARITVMIDGIEVDASHFEQDVDWQALPVNIDDVERIEVTRGPSTAGLGHALTTVLVNVVTRHPADVERGFVRGTYGSFATAAIFGRAGISEGPAAIRLTYSHNERDPMDDQGLGVLRSARQHLDRFNVRTSTRVDPQTTLAIDAAYLEDKLTGSPANAASNDIVKHTGYASGVWTRSLTPTNDVTVRLDHWFDLQNASVPGCGASQAAAGADAVPAATAFDPPSPAAGRVDPLRAAGAADAQCAVSDDDEHRTKLEVQDVQVFSGTLRGVAGLGMRQEEARTSIPAPARWTATFTRIFAGLDWQPQPAWTINAGLSTDYDAGYEHDNSMRAGVNWHLTDAQTLRASWAVGDWASQAYKILDVSNNVVTDERTDNADIGYLLKVPERNVSLDARAFWMKATGHIWAGNLSRRSGGELPAWGEVWGVETRGTADLTSRISGFLGMAYGEESATSGINASGTKTFWSGATGLYANLPDQWRVSISYTTNSGVAPVSGTPGVASATVLKDFLWLEARLRASLTYRHANSVPTQIDGETTSVSQHSFYATVEAAF
jgi:iron complex outermembrane receptor protein